jgi:hypothetical protein
MMANRAHQEIVVDVVKEALDIKVDHPEALPTPSLRCIERIVRAAPWTIAVRIWMKTWLHQRLQSLPGYSLRNAV